MTSKEWNKKYPIGVVVVYHSIIRLNSKFDMITSTRSKAWTMPSGTPVVKLNRKAGGVSLEALDILKSNKLWWSGPEDVDRPFFTDNEVCGGPSFIIRKARKDHICTLCFETIRAGGEYIYQRITPWDHSENEGFFNFKAHGGCYAMWDDVAQENDGMFPSDKGEWAEMIDKN